MVSKKNTALVVLWCAAALAVAPVDAQYTQVDYSIFDLKDSLEKVAPNETFYSLLSVETTATPAQLAKAYRQTSLAMHPDKNPDPVAQATFALLTSIVNVLRDPEARERYDHYLYHGFPVWRGTGYYYRRYRPGLGFVGLFVLLFVAFVQYVSAWLRYVQHRGTVREIERSLAEIQYKQFKAAWKRVGDGDKVSQAEFDLHRRDYVAGMLGVDLEHLEQLKLRPSIRDTVLLQLPRGALSLVWRKVAARRAVVQGPAPPEDPMPERSASAASTESNSSSSTVSSASSQRGAWKMPKQRRRQRTG